MNHNLIYLLLGFLIFDHAPQFPDDPPNPAKFARAVNHYAAMGEGPAVRALTRRARWGDGSVAWLCLALYSPRTGTGLRPPGNGLQATPFVIDTKVYTVGNSKDWPLVPLARVGKTYFVLAQGIMLMGAAEKPEEYLEYCRANGTFRTQPVPVPTRAEALHDAWALRRSAAWRSLRWKGKDAGGSWNISEEDIWQNILAQADAVRNP